MPFVRRRLLKTLGLGGALYRPAEAQDSAVSTGALREVSKFHGTNLGVDRLKVIQSALERRRSQLRALRDFELDDSIAPVQGPPRK